MWNTKQSPFKEVNMSYCYIAKMYVCEVGERPYLNIALENNQKFNR